MLGHIDSNIDNLNKLHNIYKWIPNSESIRPNHTDLENKRIMINHINNDWICPRDYILSKIFDQVYHLNLNMKYEITQIDPNIKEWVFKPSDFRYKIIPEANHYILWNLSKTINDTFPENYINCLIMDEISQITTNKYNFAWYRNPKPTIHDFYHVQVFWVEQI